MGPRIRSQGWLVLSSLGLVAGLLLASPWIPACSKSKTVEQGLSPEEFRALPDITALDEASLFTFVIFSDNKGKAPGELPAMTGMAKAAIDMKAEFALGLGDHLRGLNGYPTQNFLPFVTSLDDPFWSQLFYPNIADGENAYYGSGQGDWGAGSGLVDDLGLCQRPGVQCRDNHAEYHARIEFGDITVHFISAHYPDSGDDPFPQHSQDYLVAEVSNIQRTGHEIVIVAAHTGDWLRAMSPEDAQIILSGADLLLGATTHLYMRYDYPDNQALFLNTGAAGYSPFNNYLQVNILDNPLRLVVLNMDAEGERVLQSGGNCLVKEVGGLVSPCDLENGQAWGPFGER